MALTGGYKELAGSAVLLSSFLPEGPFKQIDVFANESNAAAIYIGPSSLATDGTDAYVALSAGRSWGHNVPGAGEQVNFELGTLYVNGASGSKIHVAIVK